jgi:hypothetical protein
MFNYTTFFKCSGLLANALNKPQCSYVGGVWCSGNKTSHFAFIIVFLYQFIVPQWLICSFFLKRCWNPKQERHHEVFSSVEKIHKLFSKWFEGINPVLGCLLLPSDE